MESFGLWADYIQQPAASLTIFQNWHHLVWLFHPSSLWPCAFVVLLLTHLNLCHSEGRQGKLSNGPRKCGKWRDNVRDTSRSTFIYLSSSSRSFNHFTSTLTCLSVRANPAKLFPYERALYSEPVFSPSCLIPFLPQLPVVVALFHKQMTRKRLLISSKPHAYPTRWNINKGSFQIEDEVGVAFPRWAHAIPFLCSSSEIGSGVFANIHPCLIKRTGRPGPQHVPKWRRQLKWLLVFSWKRQKREKERVQLPRSHLFPLSPRFIFSSSSVWQVVERETSDSNRAFREYPVQQKVGN